MPALALTPEEIRRAAVKKQVARIELARQDPNAYIEYTTKVPPQNPESGTGERWAKQDEIHREFQAEWSSSRRVVTLAPVGTGKSSQLRKRLEWELGRNHNTLISYVSASELLPKKQVAAMQEEIERNPRVRHVFPTLRKSTKAEDGREAWSAKSMLISRSMSGVSDPSLQCFGLFGKILGSRSDIIVLDDIINFENSLTEHSRNKIFDWLAEAISRLKPGARVWAVGHIWHELDALQRLQKKRAFVYKRYECWRVDEEKVRANLRGLADEEEAEAVDEAAVVDEAIEDAVETTEDPIDLQPHMLSEEEMAERAANGELKSVAPGILTPKDILEKLEDLGPTFSQMMLFNRLPHDIASRFRESWFQRCLALGRGLVDKRDEYGHWPPHANTTGFMRAWDGGQGLTYTGVDLGHRKKAGSDLTVMFTAAVLPNGVRQVIDVRSGRWKADEILANLEAVHTMFGSIMCVENNGAQQMLLDFAEYLTCLPVRPHATTGVNKHDFSHGVERMADEIRQGKWMLPCDDDLIPGEEIGKCIKACKIYDPGSHTPDHLMAWWICKEGIRLSPAAAALPVEEFDFMTRA